ncbi:glycine cleavage system aminomethyltransferase GcvT [Barrientosiimonas marina]|uniref:Aminomethyltransferase n=1 Tax=Lentibacillus kimchii TaxID=1542911 RepID=A0ABW2UXY7_9BACI
MTELKRTPLHPEYEKWGAKTIDFGGWDLPVQFAGIKHEHETTRTKAGLFDVSHMGEIMVKGMGSEDFLQRMVTNDVSRLTPKRCQYTFMCNTNGGTIDDFIVYKLQEDLYMLVVNAANREKDFNWLTSHNDSGVTIEDSSDNYVQLALQGPEAERILQRLTDTDLSAIKSFRFEDTVHFTAVGASAIVSRTGYTGEDGFEIYLDAAEGRDLWNRILEEGREDGLEPIGLGARDTLRFEAKLPLYGQELSEDITPVEAGMPFAVKVKKEAAFIGKDVLKRQKDNGPDRKLVGLEMIDKGIPRTGYRVFDSDKAIGFVTTGTQSPTLHKRIGLALVNHAYTDLGTVVSIEVRKKQLEAVVVETPFYKRD